VLKLAKNKIAEQVQSENTGAEKGKLFPTDMGMLVTDFLIQYFDNVLDYSFTAMIEREFDDISNGDKQWQNMIDDFYKPFHKDVEKTMDTAERVTGERELGFDPASGKRIVARMGRFGPMVVLESGNEEEKSKFAKIRPGQSIETISLNEALQLFQLPRKIGFHENHEVTVSEGRFGPYVLCNKTFYSLKKEQDPYTITLAEAVELMAEKAKKVIKEYKESGISILDGRWGPYVKSGKLNAKIPKGTDPATLSVDECLELLEKAKDKPKGFRRFARKS